MGEALDGAGLIAMHAAARTTSTRCCDSCNCTTSGCCGGAKAGARDATQGGTTRRIMGQGHRGAGFVVIGCPKISADPTSA